MPAVARRVRFREAELAMESRIRVIAPLTKDAAGGLVCGQGVLLSGSILLARDAAHARMAIELKKGLALPLDLEGAVLFYAGPTPAPPGRMIGSIGPTTSARMDPYTPLLLRLGVRGMIGKGRRSPEVIEAMRETGAVNFGATGGAAALLARSVRAWGRSVYDDFGADAVRFLEVEDLPLVVTIDSLGNDLYEQGRIKFYNGMNQ